MHSSHTDQTQIKQIAHRSHTAHTAHTAPPLPPAEQTRAEAAEEAAAARAKEVAAVKAELNQASLAIDELKGSPSGSSAKATWQAGAGTAVAKWQASYVARALETTETALEEANRDKVRLEGLPCGAYSSLSAHAPSPGDPKTHPDLSRSAT